jgi:hypothetical protein
VSIREAAEGPSLLPGAGRHAAAGSTGRSLLRNGRLESPFVATRSANGAACKLTDFLRKGCLDIIDWQVRLSKRMGAGENEAL